VAEGRYPDFIGGAETVIHHLCKELLSLGHEVHTLTRMPKPGMMEYELDQGVHVHRFKGLPINSPLYVLYPLYSLVKTHRCFVRLSKEVNFDRIIFNHPFPAFGILSSKRCKDIQKIYIFHSPSHIEYRMALSNSNVLLKTIFSFTFLFFKYIERFALQKCKKVITLSQYMRNQVIYYHSISEEHVEVIPGGVDMKVFSPVHDAEERLWIRTKLNMPQNPFILLVVKRLYGEMGLENIIDAIELLAERNVCLLIAGDGPLRKKLESLISSKNLEQYARLLGNVPYQQMVQYYRLSDLFISTRAEPFGLAILEALACGLPVLSVPEGGAVEILAGLSKKLLFKGTDGKTMANLIFRYLNCPDELEAIKLRCRDYVENNFTWSIFGNRLEQLVTQ
jgi:glycosyltransferase involved in cell wall biosynthesis